MLPELRAYARSLGEEADEAEDLVHDAIERSLNSPNTPNALSALRPWMFRIIRNLQHDELRKRRVRREYMAVEQRLYGEGRRTHDHARDVLIRLSYERLPPDKREILFLVDIMGLKYEEAGEVIGVATGTIMSRLSRARQALREIIDDDVSESPKVRNRTQGK